MLHVFRAWLNLIVICSSGMAEPDSDDDALASMLAPVGGHTDVAANDADTDMPTVRLNRLEHMARVNAGKKARAGPRKATRIAQNTAECTDALDLLHPSVLPKQCRLEPEAPEYKDEGCKGGVRMKTNAMIRAAIGMTHDENLADAKELSAATNTSGDTVIRSQTIVADSMCSLQNENMVAHIKEAVARGEQVLVVKDVWDEATIRLQMSRDTLRDLCGEVADSMLERKELLPNGLKRKSPSLSGQIFNREASFGMFRLIHLMCLYVWQVLAQ